MAGNTFGQLFRLITFGESHGAGVGGVIDGCPAGVTIDVDQIQQAMDRRRPGQSAITTDRNEADQVEFLSGIFEGKSTGAPIAFLIYNKDQRSEDYSAISQVYRPGHADKVWDQKFGFRDYRGGGRSSARETAARVAAGAIAQMILKSQGVDIKAWVHSVKDISIQRPVAELDLLQIDANEVRCPDQEVAKWMRELIAATKESGDSVGGIIACRVEGVPAGWGEPVFDKLHAVLAHAMLSINATKGFEMEDGFSSTLRMGSENNPISSGITGGISTGKSISFRVAFKPVSTIAKPQKAENIHGEEVTLEAKGRHDPCVLPRAVPIVEAMAALVLVDAMLLHRSNQL